MHADRRKERAKPIAAFRNQLASTCHKVERVNRNRRYVTLSLFVSTDEGRNLPFTLHDGGNLGGAATFLADRQVAVIKSGVAVAEVCLMYAQSWALTRR